MDREELAQKINFLAGRKDATYYDAECPRCGKVKAAKVSENAICDTCNNHEGVEFVKGGNE